MAGVSRKLVPIVKGESIEDVGYQWSAQRYTLAEILAKFKLPCVVQSVADSCKVLWSSFKFDLKQPLLLYSRRSVRKVKAASLRYNRDVESYVDIGPPLIIPEDYDGWFGFDNGPDRKMERHSRIETIAKLGITKFLVTSTLPVLASTSITADKRFVERVVEPGEIIRVLGPYKGDLSVVHHTSFKKSKNFLKCLDEKDDELLLCFSLRGMFYEIADRARNCGTGRITTIRKFIEEQEKEAFFPVTIRHVYGDPPAVSFSFTRVMRCQGIFSEETLLATSIKEGKAVPLEMNPDSKIKFRIALNEGEVKKTREYSKAYDVCTNNGHSYLSGIKVCFTLKPEVSPLEEIDFSLYEEKRRKSESESEERRPDYADLHDFDDEELAQSSVGSDQEMDTPECDNIDSEVAAPKAAAAEGTNAEAMVVDAEVCDSDSDTPDIDNVTDVENEVGNDSDGEDVDAQSEFEIDWGPGKEEEDGGVETKSAKEDSKQWERCTSPVAV